MQEPMRDESSDQSDPASLFIDKPASPLGIPSWLWLTLLTFFLAFIIWVSLRNTYHLLPVRVQHALQDLIDKLGLQGRIRLSDSNGSSSNIHRSTVPGSYHRYASSSRTSGASGTHAVPAAAAAVINIDLSDDEDDLSDDELPLATRLSYSGSGRTTTSTGGAYGRSQRQQKFDRIVSLFSGKGSSRSWNRLYGTGNGNDDPAEQEGTILDLPNLPASSQLSRIKKPAFTTISSQSILRTASNEGDAPSLPAQFTLPHPSPKIRMPLSPTIDRSSPRSPLRSPSLSRTPSLNAIAEETSPSPRNSSDMPQYQPFGGPASGHMSRSTSGSTDSRELPDWASARSFATQVQERSIGKDVPQ